jgi:hypothetical protein
MSGVSRLRNPTARAEGATNPARDPSVDQREVGWACSSTSRTWLEGALFVATKASWKRPIPQAPGFRAPSSGSSGMVTMATFCYATQTDPQTRSLHTGGPRGIPPAKFTSDPSKNPASKSFFSSGGTDESSPPRRSQVGPCMSLGACNGPQVWGSGFDIHYNARRAGMADLSAHRFRTLVVTVESDSPDRAARSPQRYRTMLSRSGP